MATPAAKQGEVAAAAAAARRGQPLREGLLGAFCGAQGGMLAQWVTLPIETVQRMQASFNLSSSAS